MIRKKQAKKPVPVSCFTATAKQKVISDIRDYFKRKLDVDLELFASTATRENLHYTVLFRETEEEKYNTLRALVEQKKCPAIIYVSRTRRTRELAEKLTRDGLDNTDSGALSPLEQRMLQLFYVTVWGKPAEQGLEKCLTCYVEKTARPFFFILDEWDALIREARDDAEAQKRFLYLLRGWFKNANFTPRVVAAACMTGILPIKKIYIVGHRDGEAGEQNHHAGVRNKGVSSGGMICSL